MTYIKNNDIVKRNVHGVIFLIDITDNYLDDKCRLYEINEIGSIIWDLLDTVTDNQIYEITSKIKAMIIDDVPIDIIRNDVIEFLLMIEKEHFIEEK
ncbi:MAG: PqqD family peptide modification chaperone [Lachnospiraceae bacterium]|nr:PqqD family peptide modification chaperone [Lachnospiraceae bacterium]